MSIEAAVVTFCRQEALSALYLARVTPAQIRRLFELSRPPEWPTEFD